MFEKKVQGEALILDDEGAGNVTDTDFHGVDWDHHKYILEVRPADGEPFQVETKAKVAIFSKPRPGDLVKVSYDPKSHKTEIHIEDDPRYDPKLIRANSKQERAAQKEAAERGAGPGRFGRGAPHRRRRAAALPACFRRGLLSANEFQCQPGHGKGCEKDRQEPLSGALERDGLFFGGVEGLSAAGVPSIADRQDVTSRLDRYLDRVVHLDDPARSPSTTTS
jgi:hypothetical protein